MLTENRECTINGVNSFGSTERRPSMSSSITGDSDYASMSGACPVIEHRTIQRFESKHDYLYAITEDLAEWFNYLYNRRISVETFVDSLDDGILLCCHASKLQNAAEEYFQSTTGSSGSGSGSSGGTTQFRVRTQFANYWLTLPETAPYFKTNARSGTFIARDNIANFIHWCKSLGIPDCLLFETEDLVSRKSEKNVTFCLLEVARIGAKFGIDAPEIVQMEQEIDEEIRCSRILIEEASVAEMTPEPKGMKEMIYIIPQPEEILDEPEVQEVKKKVIPKCDMKSLDEMVRDIVSECVCEETFPMKRLAEGKYLFGYNDTLIFVRVLRHHVMVRVGGGWDTLEHLVQKHDVCRVGQSTGLRSGVPVNSTQRHKDITSRRPVQPTNVKNDEKSEKTSSQINIEEGNRRTNTLLITRNNNWSSDQQNTESNSDSEQCANNASDNISDTGSRISTKHATVASSLANGLSPGTEGMLTLTKSIQLKREGTTTELRRKVDVVRAESPRGPQTALPVNKLPTKQHSFHNTQFSNTKSATNIPNRAISANIRNRSITPAADLTRASHNQPVIKAAIRGPPNRRLTTAKSVDNLRVMCSTHPSKPIRPVPRLNQSSRDKNALLQSVEDLRKSLEVISVNLTNIEIESPDNVSTSSVTDEELYERMQRDFENFKSNFANKCSHSPKSETSNIRDSQSIRANAATRTPGAVLQTSAATPQNAQHKPLFKTEKTFNIARTNYRKSSIPTMHYNSTSLSVPSTDHNDGADRTRDHCRSSDGDNNSDEISRGRSRTAEPHAGPSRIPRSSTPSRLPVARSSTVVGKSGHLSVAPNPSDVIGGKRRPMTRSGSVTDLSPSQEAVCRSIAAPLRKASVADGLRIPKALITHRTTIVTHK